MARKGTFCIGQGVSRWTRMGSWQIFRASTLSPLTQAVMNPCSCHVGLKPFMPPPMSCDCVQKQWWLIPEDS